MRSANYVEMTTTSITSAGAGAVTCTQITSLPTFTTVFGSQSTDVRYFIEDTVNKTFETGIGKVAANVLTRTRPQVTWNGTTWDDSTPSPLVFAGSGSPSSGNIKIRLCALSEISVAAVPNRQNTIAGDATWYQYPLSDHIPHSGTGGSSATLVADREYYSPYKIPNGGLLTGAQFGCDASIASSNLKWALYSIGYDGFPGQKIVDFVTTSTASTGIKTDTATGSWTPAGPVWLTPGWYYIGFVCSHAIGVKCGGSGVSFISGSPLGKGSAYGTAPWVYVAGSYASGMPAIPSLGSAGLGDAGVKSEFWLGLKVVG